jgi:TP901 family phage tail tape measure protein
MRTEGAQRFAADVDADAAAVTRLDRATKTTGRHLTTSAKQLDRFGKSAQRTGRWMSRHVTAPLGLAGGAAVKLAVDFDKGMRNVNSLAQLPEKQLKRLSDQVLALAGPTAQAPETLAAGLYDLVSTGYNARDALKVLKQGAFAATAGLTDAATSTGAIVSGLQAYHWGADQATKVSDVWFKTVDIGRISFEQLTSELGQVLAPANAIGVPIESLGAAMATLTKGGYSAGEAATGLRNIFTQLLKPTPQLQEQLEKMGVKSGPEAVKKFGSMQEVLVRLRKGVHGNVPEFAKLFRSQQAVSAGFALTGDNAQTAAKDLDGVQKSSGATAKALSQQTKSTAYRWQRLVANLKKDAITVGETVLPVLDKVIGKTTELIDQFKGLPKPVRQAAGYIALGLAALGPLLVAGGGLARGAGAIGKLLGRRGGKVGRIGGKLAGKYGGATPVYVVNMGMGGMGGGGGKKTSTVRKAGKWLSRAAPFAARAAPYAGPLGAIALQTWFWNKVGRHNLPARAGGAARRREAHGTVPFRPQAINQRSMATGVYRPPGTGMVARNTAAYRGYRGIPTQATANASVAKAAASSAASAASKSAGEVAGRTAAKWADMRPVQVTSILNVDGRQLAKSVQTAARKDKARK